MSAARTMHRPDPPAVEPVAFDPRPPAYKPGDLVEVRTTAEGLISNSRVLARGATAEVPRWQAELWVKGNLAVYTVRVRVTRDNVIVRDRIHFAGDETVTSAEHAVALHNRGDATILDLDKIRNAAEVLHSPARLKPDPVPVDPYRGQPRLAVKVLSKTLHCESRCYSQGETAHLPEIRAVEAIHHGHAQLVVGATLTERGRYYLQQLATAFKHAVESPASY